MTKEREALHRLAKAAANRAGMTVEGWCKAHQVSYGNLLPRDKDAKWQIRLGTIYKVCEAAGVKPSQFFAAIGR